jgi:hypothetical protein
MRVRVFDAATGFAVPAAVISVQDAASGRAVFPPPTEEAAASATSATGELALALGAGDYFFAVAAAGYKSSRAILRADAAAPPQVDFYLDPLEWPAEIAPSRLRKLHRNDATLLAGFVSDGATGQALAGARVRVAGTALAAVTNARGYFELRVPIPAAAKGMPTADVVFEADGYVSELHAHVELQANSDWIYRVRLERGSGARTVDERRNRGRGTGAGEVGTSLNSEPAQACDARAPSVAAPAQEPQTPPATTNVPDTIRVGRNCTGRTCPTVEVHSLEMYVKHVLPAEWFSCWGSLSGGMNSLRAGAVAIRSYGTYHQQHPINPAYDICDTTSCQVFGSATSTNANQATDDTAGFVLVDAAGDISATEYSAENNNTGCGDCLTGRCVFDPVCCGFAANGHGRGMCQWGSARWATGTRILTSAACSLGQAQGYGSKTWQEILQLYYPALFLSQGVALGAGDRVRAMQDTEVRGTAGLSGALICTAAAGSTGTIIGGPAAADNLTWLQIAWDNNTGGCTDGTTGWSRDTTLLKIGNTVAVSADGPTVYFTATLGQATIPARGVMLREANRRAEAWTASTTTPWVVVNSGSGTTPGLLRLGVNIAGLAAGSYNGTVTIQSPTGAFAPFSVNVQLVLHEGPVGNVERSVATTHRRVDGYDLLRLARAYGADPTKANWDPAVNLVDTDANGNGAIEPSEMVIDANDLAELARNFGKSG